MKSLYLDGVYDPSIIEGETEQHQSFSDMVGLKDLCSIFKFQKLSMLSRCSLFRGFLSIYDEVAITFCSARCMCKLSSPAEKEIFSMCETIVPTGNGILFDQCFRIIQNICNQGTASVRLYGLQTLETWFNRVKNYCNANVCTNDDYEIFDDIIFKLSDISLMLTKTWSHPSKSVSLLHGCINNVIFYQVNHMVPVVFEQLVNVVATVTENYTFIENYHISHNNSDPWDIFIDQALQQPVQHK